MPARLAQTCCLDVARLDDAALARVVGLGNMHLAPTLQAFAEESLREGRRRLAVDLSPCPGMDSTFMGTLVGLSVTLRENGGWLCLLNAGADCERQMRMLGVWEFMPVLRQPLEEPPGRIRLYPDGDTDARLEAVREAHRRLIEVNPDNRGRFGAFLEAVEREIRERERRSGAAEAP